MKPSRKVSSMVVKEAVTAAKELRYSNIVIDRIKNAKNENEITRILTGARKGDIR